MRHVCLFEYQCSGRIHLVYHALNPFSTHILQNREILSARAGILRRLLEI
jgi:hypothetical protein